jgi:hypothetical protein
MVVLSIVGVSLLLTATVAALAWIHAPLRFGEPAGLRMPSTTPLSSSSRPWRNF